MSITDTKIRIYVTIVTTLYVLAFMWSYVEFLSPVWSYMGYNSTERDAWHNLTVVTFCILPCLWMPIRITRPSMTVYWVLYLMTYIGMILGVSLSKYFDTNDIYKFDLVMLLAFYLNGVSYKFKIVSLKGRKFSTRLFWILFTIVTMLFFAYVIYVFRGKMSFVNPLTEDIYEQRFLGRDHEKGTGAGYIVMWLSGNFLCLLLAYGIINKSIVPILLCLVGQFVLYMTMADKAFLLSIIFMIFINWLCKRKSHFGLIFVSILAVFTVLFTITQTYYEDDLGETFWTLANLFLVRTIAISSLTANLYYYYFQDHPLTYYSHVNILNKFIPYSYPYGDEMIGVVIGTHYTNIPRFNMNATFYLTDGLIALGLYGIPFIALFCAGVFYLIDSVSAKHDLSLSSMLISFINILLMNGSIFMSFLSGGLFFILAFLYFSKPETLKRG